MTYRSDSDAGRFLRGDEETVGEVIRWIAGVITSPPFWTLRAEWSDLQQETLWRVLESLRHGRFDATRSFRAYVRGVARITALRARSGRRERALETVPGAGYEPGDAPRVAEGFAADLQLARLVLDEMPEECRQLVWAHYCEGKTFGEIAEEEGVPVGTVKSRIFRCLSAARRFISR